MKEGAKKLPLKAKFKANAEEGKPQGNFGLHDIGLPYIIVIGLVHPGVLSSYS